MNLTLTTQRTHLLFRQGRAEGQGGLLFLVVTGEHSLREFLGEGGDVG